jgi:adenosine deaminase
VSGAAGTFARKIPKAELHVHLEGTMTPASYARIAARNGIDAGDPAALFACDDFQSFLRCFLSLVRVLRTPEDFAELAGLYLAEVARLNVRHVEFFLSPATQRKFVPELDIDMMIHAVFDACERARSQHGVSSLILIDMVRNLGEAEAMKDIELARRSREYGVVGVGLGGDERNFPARDFRSAFARARDAGLRRTVHAGEAAGPESIVDAVTLLGAERVGHAAAARGHADVLALLREKGVAIDACPTSNRITGAIGPHEVHPLREFLEAGVTVTLNSDDPAFFKSSVADEYEIAATLVHLHDIAAIARGSFAASFLPEDDRRKLVEEVDAYVEEAGITR